MLHPQTNTLPLYPLHSVIKIFELITRCSWIYGKYQFQSSILCLCKITYFSWNICCLFYYPHFNYITLQLDPKIVSQNKRHISFLVLVAFIPCIFARKLPVWWNDCHCRRSRHKCSSNNCCWWHRMSTRAYKRHTWSVQCHRPSAPDHRWDP